MNDSTMFEVNTHLQVTSDFGMYYCGKRINTLNHVYGPEIRKHYLFVFVNSGKATLHTEKENISFGTGDLLIMLPNEKVYYTTSTNWSIQWIGLYGESIKCFIRKLKVDKTRPIISVGRCNLIKNILDNLYCCAKENSYSSEIMQASLIYNFFAVLFEQVDTTNDKDYVLKAKKIIDYCFDSITVEKLSNSIHLNSSYLSRIFTKQLKISPKQYIINKKLERAKELLLTDLSLSEISNSIGFNDNLYFSRIFKQREGMSPSAYRKQKR